MNIHGVIRDITDKQSKLKSSDKNKNRIYKEYEDGSKEWIYPGSGGTKVVEEKVLHVDIVDAEPEVLENGMIWIRRDLL